MVKNLPAMRETGAPSLGQEDSPKKRMAAHSSALTWRVPWTEVSGEPQSMGPEGRTQPSDLHSLSLFLLLA